ncbi:MAG: AtpZ/AtpI family protein [Desulfovibrio sp.]|nr:AtpZ/AtpI family protein [Desulfovibrio sp.]
MDIKGFLNLQTEGARAMSNAGVIGLHMVSGPAVGFGIGYGLDCWLATTPWCGLAFLFVGIGAGFLNVWRDTRQLMRKLDRQG